MSQEAQRNYRKMAIQKKYNSSQIKVARLKEEVKTLEEQIIQDDQYSKELPPHLVEFCELYVNGGFDYAGRGDKCYKKVFECPSSSQAKARSRELLRKPYIISKIESLSEENQIEIQGKKMMIEETLVKIMQEGATATFENKYGKKISPAAMRSVAISAAAKLSELNGLDKPKEIRITDEDGAGVVFNVIVPQVQQLKKDEVKNDSND